MNKKIMVICRSSSFDQLKAKEALDVAMLLGSFEQDISLLFLEDGVFQLLPNQHAELIGSKDYAAVINALPFYDVEQIYCCKQSLEERKLNKLTLQTHIQALATDKVQEMIKQSDIVFNF